MEQDTEFGLRVITSGSIRDISDGKPYRITATVVQLNWVALNEWQTVYWQRQTPKGYFEDDAAYLAHWDECNRMEAEFEQQVARCLGIDTTTCRPIVAKDHAEIFTVIEIRRESEEADA